MATRRSRGLTTTFGGHVRSGHNAWQMTSAALVLFMTLPGLALFYGGLVRHKNVLSVMANAFCSAAGSRFSGGVRLQPGLPQRNSFLGGLGFAFPQGRRLRAQHRLLLLGFPLTCFSMYQLMFAIITPAPDVRRDRRTQ